MCSVAKTTDTEEEVESPLRTENLQPGDPAQCSENEIPPLLETGRHRVNFCIASVQRCNGCSLGNRCSAGGYLALDFCGVSDNRRRPPQITDAPPCHRIGLGNTIDRDDLIADLFECPDADVFPSIINHLLINLIAD